MTSGVTLGNRLSLRSFLSRRHGAAHGLVNCVGVYQEFSMDHFVVTASAARQLTDCAIVGVYEKGVLSAAADELDTRLRGSITRLARNGDFRGRLGETLLLGDLKNSPKTSPCDRIVLVGLGARD